MPWCPINPKLARAISALALCCVLVQSDGKAQIKPVRRVLIRNELGASNPGIAIINGEIQAALNESRYGLEFYSACMDTGSIPDPADQQEFRDFYVHKYQNRKPDVIITVGPSSLKLMQQVHKRAFPGVPTVFCWPQTGAPGAPALDSDFTDVENDMAPAMKSPFLCSEFYRKLCRMQLNTAVRRNSAWNCAEHRERYN